MAKPLQIFVVQETECHPTHPAASATGEQVFSAPSIKKKSWLLSYGYCDSSGNNPFLSLLWLLGSSKTSWRTVYSVDSEAGEKLYTP